MPQPGFERRSKPDEIGGRVSVSNDYVHEAKDICTHAEHT